jgi:hypothetical protein
MVPGSSREVIMRSFVLALAAASLIAGAAAPAAARGRHWRHHDRVDAGDVIGGALAIGGIAALISAIGKANGEKQDAAVDTCSREAEARLGGKVERIGAVVKSKGYYTIEGALSDPDGGPGDGFSCTIRNGTIYGFRSSAAEA